MGVEKNIEAVYIENGQTIAMKSFSKITVSAKSQMMCNTICQ